MRLPVAITHPSPRALLWFAASASAAMLAAALVAQYGFGLYPCHLCMYQRYPYAAIIVIAVLAILLCKRSAHMRAAVLLIAALFVVDAGIAFYHTGVEFGWFTGPSGCTSTSRPGQTLEELRRQIMEAPDVSCDQAMGYVFGLSLALWNTISASGLAFLMLLGLKRSRA